MVGGATVLAECALLEVDLLRALMETAGVTAVGMVPSILDVFLQSSKGFPPSVQHVFSCGEELPPSTARRFFNVTRETEQSVSPQRARLWNLYGPTESAIYSHCAEVTKESADLHPRLSIGKPIARRVSFVLDAERRLVSRGSVGVLHIGGAGLARRYCGDDARTERAFVVVDLPRFGAVRLFVTGDLVRMRADGSLDYLGRVDTQIKLRGLRIELGEVESAVASARGVQTAVVVVVPTASTSALSPTRRDTVPSTDGVTDDDEAVLTA